MTEKNEALITEAEGYIERYGVSTATLLIERLIDAFEAATRERDAARAEIESRIEDRDYWHGVATRAKDQRDAAVAAVERVRAAIAGPHPANSGLSSFTLAHVLAALDGAPEPEDVWEYGYELIEPDDRNVFEREGDFISAAFAYRASKKRIHEERHPDVPSLKYAIIRRRKAGPWEPLPVEGETE